MLARFQSDVMSQTKGGRCNRLFPFVNCEGKTDCAGACTASGLYDLRTDVKLRFPTFGGNFMQARGAGLLKVLA
jgi:hypothetical protein